MPVTIKKTRKRLVALTFMEKAKPRFYRIINKFIKEEVLKSIQSGRSPVHKGGTDPRGTSGSLRYAPYSDSYKKAIKKGRIKNKTQSPRNLTASGKMLRSIKSKKFKNFVRVWFTDSKAKYHDRLGAGKAKTIRRMAPRPKSGEQFNAGIRKRIVNALKNAIKLSKK